MVGGYIGKLLFVDLSTGKMEEQNLDEAFCRKFIGGYGFGARILYDRIPANTDALSPRNILGFLTGPLTGTPALIGSRYVVVGKSPLTNGWGDANSGGYFGPALKFAGYDGVFFGGVADKPTYLLIREGRAELHHASSLWGKDTNETDDILKAEHGSDIRLACIGPSGEKKSFISCIINDKGRAAGRSGLGAVMGSKLLKAVVCKGKIDVPIADKTRAQELRSKYLKSDIGALRGMLQKYGTAGLVAYATKISDTPIKNWSCAGPVDFPNAPMISGKAINPREEKKFACWHCPIACGGYMKSPEGTYAVSGEAHKPEYETLCAFGTNCLNDNLDSIIKLNEICNRAGLDTISTGCTVAFAIECYENGILTKTDTDGLELTWGNHASIVAITEKIARREGLGDILADGVKVASEKIGKGAEDLAIHIGGQEVPMHDPKCTPGLATTYRLDATPARHTQGSELVRPEVGLEIQVKEPIDYTGRGEDQKKLMNMMHFVNAAGLCEYGYASFGAYSVPEFFNAITGFDVTMEECLETGERIATVRHLFNLRERYNPLSMRVPGRVLGKPPLKAGPVRDIEVDEDTMIRDYLLAMGWDTKTALPSRERLLALGLEDIV